MAVRLEGTIKRFIGLSTDGKPEVGTDISGAVITALDLPPGSSFKETDTGRILRWDGYQWTYDPFADDRLREEMEGVHGTLREIKDLVEALLEKV